MASSPANGKTLRTILKDKAANAQPLLMQIACPPTTVVGIMKLFSAIYPKFANEFDIPLLPFFMEEAYLKPNWMQDDGSTPPRCTAVYCRLDGNAAGSFS